MKTITGGRVAAHMTMSSDTRGSKAGRLAHSEILIPTEMALKELYFDVRVKSVDNAKVKLWPRSKVILVERSIRENGAHRIYTALVKLGFCNLRMCFKVMYIDQTGLRAVRTR